MKKKALLFLLVSLFIYACEYKTADIYPKEIGKPDPNREIIINLSEVQPEDIINIYQPTWLGLDINSPSYDILAIKMFLDGELLNTNWLSCFIDPAEFDNNVHDLMLLIEVKTNTSSLAEKLGVEKYLGESKYKIKFVRTTKELHIGEDITEDSYLKIVWEKPVIEGLEVDKYEIRYRGLENAITIADPDETFYIHKNYIAGPKDYYIKTYFKGNKMDPWEDEFHGEYYAILNGDPLNVEIIDPENIRISWTKNKYRTTNILAASIGLYDIQSAETRIELDIDYSETSVTIPNPAFPNSPLGSFTVSSELQHGTRSSVSFDLYKSYPKLYHNYASSFAYDPADNAIYGLSTHNIIKYDAGNLQPLRDISIEYLDYFGNSDISCSFVSHKIAARGGNTAYILDDQLRILKQFTIPGILGYSDYDNIFQITDNDLLIVSEASASQEISVYDIAGELLYKPAISVTNPYRTVLTSSYDGKLCHLNRYDISIYQFNETSETLIYQQNIPDIISCNFHPTDANIVIIQLPDRFYLFDISNNRTVISINGTYMSADPFTGNIAYYDENYNQNRFLNLLDPGSNTLLTRIRVTIDYGIFIYNNILIGDNSSYYEGINNCYIDLSKYF
jgi:hypothetical protein